ncbi:hypothetical protein ABR189_29865 [Chitinophaga sp. H8]|uniref:NERD domain-containing protein n=2 Tax=Chitinophaga defluvii TaxID=3163343 RepID=A0ABV2TF12_9BACT
MMDLQDYAIYRRVLKLCLEHACDVEIKFEHSFSLVYLDEIASVLEQILYIGAEAYYFSSYLAEEKMSATGIDILYEDNCFTFRRSFYQEFLQLEMMGNSQHSSLAVFNNQCFTEFQATLKKCFSIEYKDIAATIWLIHDYNANKGGELVLCNWSLFPAVLEEAFGTEYKYGDIFFSGLTINKNNKLSLRDAIYKPDNLNRCLYRPILIWNVNGKPMAILGEAAFDHAIISLCINGFGWGKYPKEWVCKCFDEFVNKQKHENGTRLENAIEKIFMENNILYDRNLKFIRKYNNRNININNMPGEIDFLFIHEGRIYVVDSKYQMLRYDMNNFRNDYSYFNEKYNLKLSQKIKFIADHLKEIEEHFQILKKDYEFKLKIDVVEGLFIINVPTFVMINNEHKIVTLFELLNMIGKGPTYKSYSFTVTKNGRPSLGISYHD